MNRHFLFGALFLLISILGFGQGYQVQSKYFVYLQTEPAQPFYIKINDQKITANASGYLILPQLKDGNYKLTVGFADGKTPEQRFDFRIDSKDKGYLIKDYGAEGWGLFDLQTMVVQNALKGNEKEAVAIQQEAPKQAPKPDPVPAEDVTDFTKILSQAANDPSLLEKPKPAPVEEKPVVAAETAVATPAPTVVETPAQPQEQKTPAGVSQSKPTVQMGAGNGVSIVYDDRNESGQVDPITIFIPAPQKAIAADLVQDATPPVVEEPQQKTEEQAPQPVKEGAGEAGFKVEEKAALPQQEGATEVVKNSNEACKKVAGESAFLQLRRAMASGSNDDEMIATATKAFKSQCYTTAQIKYLSSMFLSNAGKYNFFAVARDHVADRENMGTLVSEIKDKSYQDKFNSLIQ